MTENGLQSGAAFFRRLMLILGLMSTVAVALISLYFHALLRLSDAEWRGFLAIVAGLAPTLFVVTSLLNRPLYTPITRYLDAAQAGAESRDGLRDAFRAISALPVRFFLNGLFCWAAAGLFAAAVMGWRFEAFGIFRASAMSLAVSSGGFVCSIFMFFGVKEVAAGTRDELSRRIGDPAERQALVRRIGIGSKLRWSVTGVTFVTVAFALFLSLVQASAPLEANSVEIQSRFLAARAELLQSGPAAWDRVRDEARALGIADDLLRVDLASQRVIEGDAGLLLETEIAEMRTAAGVSTQLESPHVFAWRALAEGGPVAVLVRRWETLSPQTAGGWLRFGLTLLVSAAIALGLAHQLSRDIGVATRELVTSAERVASGDLRSGGGFESEDELGDLARAFEKMAGALRATVGRVSETADRAIATAGETATVSESLASSSESQAQGVAETAQAMQSLSSKVSEIAGSAQELNLLVEDASSSIMELGASGEQLADTADLLFAKADAVSSSIQEGVRSGRQVSSNAAALVDAAENTSVSSAQMAKSMREVNAAAEDSAERSRQVVATAERGRETVRQTVESMEAIRRATGSAESVVRGLGDRAAEIGTVVDVIGGVADETNLLALNAAIIAAQSGEQGRAFSVVAGEIKALADRVLASTREIGDLIRGVQEESRNAVEAIEAGAGSVAEGVRLSNEAGASLEEITRVSRESGERIEQILGAVQEQTQASSYVVEQMESVKLGVDAIQRATSEQDRGNETIVESTEAMREIAQQLRGTTSEQARGSSRLRESIEGVRSATESIHSALAAQGQSSTQVGRILEVLASKGESNEESARRMQEVTRQLLAQAAALREDVERFSL